MIINGERALAYLVNIDEILPIEGADRIEVARVGGWQVVVGKKDNFKVGDLVVYIEIDSRVPSDREEFAFLKDRKYKVKTIKLRGQVSQGLIMPFSILPEGNWTAGDDVTQVLGIKKIEEEKVVVNRSREDKLKNAHPSLIKKPWFKKMMKHEWFRNFAFKFLIPKKKKTDWPQWVTKTDSERIQNMIWILKDKGTNYYVSEKVDGSSTTFTLFKNKGRFKFLTCSRNVVMDTPNKHNYYSDFGLDNIYQEMAIKYDIEKKMRQIWNVVGAKFNLTIQGETFGAGVQKNNYGLDHREFRAFNLYVDGKYIKLGTMEKILKEYNIPVVPIVDYNYTLPDTFEELMDYSTGQSALYDGLKEGYVFKDASGDINFKCVSNDYLLSKGL